MPASTEVLAPTLVAAAPEPPGDERRASRPSNPRVTNADAAGLLDTRSDLLAGRYRMDAVLAEGGMAVVYRAWHCLLEQPVALKMLRAEYSSVPEIAERFLQEARAVARLRSNHVVRVMDFGATTEGNRYMVLELLNGRDLQHLLSKEGAQRVERAVGFVLQAAEALAEAHSTGLVHRDIKPANLFLAKESGSEIIKVIDFGICKSLCRKSAYRTLSKSYLGSPQYMSPEQIQSAASVDARTDIWALGVVLFELLTGRAPFRGATLPALCASVISDTPIWPEHLPEGLGRVVMRCLAKRREDRYATMAEFAAALEGFAEPVEAPQVTESEHRHMPHSDVRVRARVGGWQQKLLACGVLVAASGAFGWGLDVVALRDEGTAAPGLPPALVNAALAAGAGDLTEPVPMPMPIAPAQVEREPAPEPFEVVARPAAVEPSRAGAPAPRVAERPVRATSARSPKSDTARSAKVDMEARYALTYQPDQSITSAPEKLVSATPAPPGVGEPVQIISDL